MIDRAEQERGQAGADHGHAEDARAEQPARGKALARFELEEFVDREAERDERGRSPDPRHQRALVREPRPVGCEPGPGIGRPEPPGCRRQDSISVPLFLSSSGYESDGTESSVIAGVRLSMSTIGSVEHGDYCP